MWFAGRDPGNVQNISVTVNHPKDARLVGEERRKRRRKTLDEIVHLLHKPNKCHVNNTPLIYINGKHYTNT